MSNQCEEEGKQHIKKTETSAKVQRLVDPMTIRPYDHSALWFSAEWLDTILFILKYTFSVDKTNEFNTKLSLFDRNHKISVLETITGVLKPFFFRWKLERLLTNIDKFWQIQQSIQLVVIRGENFDWLSICFS